MKFRHIFTTTLWILIVALCGLLITGCDEGMNVAEDVLNNGQDPTVPGETANPITNGEVTDPVNPVTNGEVKQPPEGVADPVKPEPKPEDPKDPVKPDPEDPVEPEPADTIAPEVVRVGWYTDKKLRGLMYNNRQPGATLYAKVVFSEPVEHIVGDGVSARPALSLVVGGQATRLRVLPRDAGNTAFVSGTCKPLEGKTNAFACTYTVPAGNIGTVALQVGEETADTAGNAVIESQHIAPFMIEEPELVVEVVPPLKTLVPPTSQEHPPPESSPGDFVGQVRTLYSTNNVTVNSTQPIAGVSVTITTGPRANERVITDQGGYYHFLSINTDELYLRVEREHFEPKEVIVHRTRPTVLQKPNGGPTIDRKDPWNTPGTVVIGQRWPDAIRFIFEETLLPNDVLFVRDDGYKSYKFATGLYYISGNLSGIVTISVNRAGSDADMLRLLAHELGHAHQHAVAIVNNADSWTKTPEGRAYAQARERDWDEVGKTALDQSVASKYREDLHLSEGAADISSAYWGRGIWLGKGAVGLETKFPNRTKWAEEWLNKQYD